MPLIADLHRIGTSDLSMSLFRIHRGIYDEKLFAIGTNKSLGKKNCGFFILALRLLVPILQEGVRQICRKICKIFLLFAEICG